MQCVAPHVLNEPFGRKCYHLFECARFFEEMSSSRNHGQSAHKKKEYQTYTVALCWEEICLAATPLGEPEITVSGLL